MINATGYEVTHFIEKNIVQLNSTFACVSESFNSPEDLWKNDLLLWNTANPYLYMRLTEDNRILIGGRDETFVNIKKRDKLIPSKSQQLKKDFKKLFPAIPMEPEFSWTGTFGTTRDALPFIGPYAKTPNTFYALGFGGNGITFSVIAAQIICDLVQGKHNADAQLFAFDR